MMPFSSRTMRTFVGARMGELLAARNSFLTTLSLAALAGVLAVAVQDAPVTYALAAGVADIHVGSHNAPSHPRRQRRCHKKQVSLGEDSQGASADTADEVSSVEAGCACAGLGSVSAGSSIAGRG